MALGRFLKKLIDRWTGREKPAPSPVEYDPVVDDDQRPSRYWSGTHEAEGKSREDSQARRGGR